MLITEVLVRFYFPYTGILDEVILKKTSLGVFFIAIFWFILLTALRPHIHIFQIRTELKGPLMLSRILPHVKLDAKEENSMKT